MGCSKRRVRGSVNYFRYTGKRLYTLVELMVTIAIIAILLTLLLTALGKGKETVERTACVNNMKEMASALYGFSGDNSKTWTVRGNVGMFVYECSFNNQ